MRHLKHVWWASFMALGFLGSRCSVCGAKRILGGYPPDERCDRIVARLNKSWRVR